MIIQVLLALFLLPFITADIVYARTNRLDQAEFDQWNKTCGMGDKKLPNKVMVHVSKKDSTTKKCVGVIINKYFVLTTATCYYDRTLNTYYNDAELRVATNPVNTIVVICDDGGINCEKDKGLKEIRVKKVIYPQLIHYSAEYEKVADIALLEIVDFMDDNRQICTPPQDEMFAKQKIFLISHDITDQPYYEGNFEWKGERSCGDSTTCAEKYTFKPKNSMKKKLSSGLFLVQKNNRMYILGTLKYEEDSPKIMLIFPLFYDFVCSNTGDCGAVYDKYMFFRETRVIVNGIPLPQVSHCDVQFATCDYDPLFFRFLPEAELKHLENDCGRQLEPVAGQQPNNWHKFPYMAAIRGNERICSGAFISRVHVVTVAHCLFEYEKDKKDEFFELRDKTAGSYIDPANFEVRYGSECYADGIKNPSLDKCENPEHAKSIKTSKVRSIIVDVDKLRPGMEAHWRYKYKLVLLELEDPASKQDVIPICTFPGTLMRSTSYPGSSEDSFDFTAAGNPDLPNTFVSATGNKIEATNCDDFRKEKGDPISDYNCRDDNVDLVTLGESSAKSFDHSSPGFLGAQLSVFNGTSKRRYLYGLAPYYTRQKETRPEDNILGAFYPIWKQEQFICWFTGVCYYRGRPDNRLYRHAKIYTPEYRLTRSVLDAPVQRAGKNNVSYYEIVMLEEMDTQW